MNNDMNMRMCTGDVHEAMTCTQCGFCMHCRADVSQASYLWHIQTLQHGTQPPEMLHEGRLSKACDVYSLGMIAWELLSGQHPFEGMLAGQVFYHVVVLQQREEVPAETLPALKALIQGCWAHDPAARCGCGMHAWSLVIALITFHTF